MPEFTTIEAAPMGDADLSPASVAFIERFLFQRPKVANLDRAVEIDDLIAYLLGEAPQDDACAIERLLVRDAEARGLHRAVDRAVESIRRLAWDDVIRLADGERAGGGDAVPARVARIWQQRLTRQMRLSPASLTRYLRDSGGWNGLKRDAEDRGRDRALAWSTLSAMLWQSLRPPVARAAYAAVRGESGALADPRGAAIDVMDLPARYREAAVEVAEITAEGALHVRIGLRPAAGHRLAGADPRERIRLEFKAGSRTWLLDESIVSADSVEWSVPNACAGTGLTPGPVDPSRMTLRFGRASRRRLAAARTGQPEAKPAVPETVTAAVFEADGRPSETRPALELSMPAAPTISAGRLRLTLGMPASARVFHASSRLNVDLLVAPERTQRLAGFAVDRWADDGAARLLDIPWPGGASSRTDAGLVLMLLQISLRVGAGSRAANPER